jgi:mannose-6-phosphate isomerase-like protein (cupin superfamily)
MNTPINIQSKFKLFSDYWSPKVIAELNDYQFKLVKIKGEFTWHKHKNTDEVFIVIEGSMGIEFKDKSIELNIGEMIVVKKKEEHKPFANEECKVLIIEPRGVINTGDLGGELTSKNDVWI